MCKLCVVTASNRPEALTAQLADGHSRCGVRNWTTSTYTVHIRTSCLLLWEAAILVPTNSPLLFISTQCWQYGSLRIA